MRDETENDGGKCLRADRSELARSSREDARRHLPGESAKMAELLKLQGECSDTVSCSAAATVDAQKPHKPADVAEPIRQGEPSMRERPPLGCAAAGSSSGCRPPGRPRRCWAGDDAA